MKRHIACLSLVLLLSALCSAAQTPKADPPKPVPVLSTAEKVAISSVIEKEQGLQNQFKDLEQQKATIIAEFGKEHPGFHVNPQGFAVEADAPKAEVKPAPPAPKPTYPAGGANPKASTEKNGDVNVTVTGTANASGSGSSATVANKVTNK